MNGNSKENIIYFAAVLLGAFLIFFVVFLVLGITPESISLYKNSNNNPVRYEGSYSDTQVVNDNISTSRTEPNRIVIEKIGVDTSVDHPKTRDIYTLDQSLNKGAVYYPGSGSIESGNMFVFGHSADAFVVQNPAYKTFNRFNELVGGDVIEVEADGNWL